MNARQPAAELEKEVVEATQRAAAGEAPGGRAPRCVCLRYLVCGVCMPLLLVISLLGWVAWGLLLPATLVCPAVGCGAMASVWVLENAAKAPLRALLWASGALAAADRAVI